MQIIRSASEFFAARRALPESLALVPTMGALHGGHLALVAEGRRRADCVAATIFVNPLQFGPGEDLARYPRQEERDLELLAEQGCDLVWLPTAADLFPPGFSTQVSIAGVSERWEGAARPGHFTGVALVVAKLLIAATPQIAIFGEKDWQQLMVIRRMARDLGLPVEIAGFPTVRDPDGLALSSRNAYLSPSERANAVALPASLDQARRRIAAGTPVADALGEARAVLASAGFAPIDYFALVVADTLEPLDEPAGPMRLITAASIGTTRLIDNIGAVSD